MKHFTKILLIACFVWIVTPQAADAATCSGTAVRSNGQRVPFSYTIVGKNISNGSYQFGNQTYNGVTSSVTMTFKNPNLAKAVANTCFSQDWMNKAADSAAYFIPQFLASGKSSWTQSIISCGNTHVYSKSAETITATNGVCGVAKNTCSVGNSGNTSEDSTKYRWSCAGSNGGTTAQCSLDKDGGRNGGGDRDGSDNDNDIDQVTVLPVDFRPVCTAIPNYAAADGDDAIVWTIRDGDGRSFSGYNFTWSYTGPQGANFKPSNEQAIVMTSNTPLKITPGQVSARVYGGTLDTTVQCKNATFGEGIEAVFSKPVIGPAPEQCRLNWNDINVAELPTCKIYNEQDEVLRDISSIPSGFYEVAPNAKYYIKCEAPVDPENPDAEIGTVQTEFLSCVRRGSLIEI